MVKKCVYCKCEVDEESVVDVCERCGHGVWGKKMFNAIVENMSSAKANGNLNQGFIGEEIEKIKKV